MLLHHPFVSIIQHITSPLTSALCIFGVYKASHIPKIRAWLKAIWIINKSGGVVKQHHVPKKTSPFAHPHHRSYHTSTPAAAAAAAMRASSFLRNQGTIASSVAAASRVAVPALFRKAPAISPAAAAALSTSSFAAAANGVGVRGGLALGRVGLLGPGAVAMPAVGLKHLLSGGQQRRNLAGHAAVAGNVLQEAMRHTYLFPSSWYVSSPYTGEDIILTSEFMQNLLQCKLLSSS